MLLPVSVRLKLAEGVKPNAVVSNVGTKSGLEANVEYVKSVTDPPFLNPLPSLSVQLFTKES